MRAFIGALALLAFSTPALAHQSMQETEIPGTGEHGYFFSDHGAASTWRETNGLTTSGVYSAGRDVGKEDPSLVSGLQITGACLPSKEGVFAPIIAAINLVGPGYAVFSYLPANDMHHCHMVTQQIIDVCTEECGPEDVACFDACDFDVSFVPADEIFIGQVPPYAVGTGGAFGAMGRYQHPPVAAPGL